MPPFYFPEGEEPGTHAGSRQGASPRSDECVEPGQRTTRCPRTTTKAAGRSVRARYWPCRAKGPTMPYPLSAWASVGARAAEAPCRRYRSSKYTASHLVLPSRARRFVAALAEIVPRLAGGQSSTPCSARRPQAPPIRRTASRAAKGRPAARPNTYPPMRELKSRCSARLNEAWDESC